MSPEERRQDPQDKEFGAQASRDADKVDQVREEEGTGAVSDTTRSAPRASGKAEPGGG